MLMFSGLAASQPSARRWTTLASFSLQAAVIAAVIVLPMFYPQNLPQALPRLIFVPMSNGEVRAATSPVEHTGSTGPSLSRPIVVSRDLHVLRFGSAHPADNQPPGLDPSIGLGDPNSPIATLMNGPSGPVLPNGPPSNRIRTSVVMEGNLIRRVEPQYPVIAKQIHLEGAVVLNAIIGRDGNIERMEVASGPTLLAAAAKEAVSRWKYRPYLLNGEPVEVETQITVNFVLAH
jgi:protein TonB